MTIIKVFQKSRKPLCIKDIKLIFPEIKQSTLYHILKLLVENKIIIKSNPPSDFILPIGKRDRTFYIFN